MIKPLLSVIIPIYNVEKYLEDCVMSVINQDFSDYEILLIDDGSTDKSSNIADNLEDKYSRVKTFHKSNGGLSDARNYGIRNAGGNYITFIDSDDTVSPFYLRVLYNAFKLNENIDISVIRYINVSSPTKKYEDSTAIEKNAYTFLTGQEATEQMLLQKGYDVSAWAKMYKKEFFIDNMFKKDIVSEDYQLIPKLFLRANQVAYNESIGYYYLQREGSIMKREFSKDSLYIIDIAREIYIETLNYDKRIQIAASSKAISALTEQYSLLSKFRNITFYDQAEQDIRENIDYYLNNITIFSSVKFKIKVFRLLQKLIGKAAYKIVIK